MKRVEKEFNYVQVVQGGKNDVKTKYGCYRLEFWTKDREKEWMKRSFF